VVEITLDAKQDLKEFELKVREGILDQIEGKTRKR
jgi:hypothetical protein